VAFRKSQTSVLGFVDICRQSEPFMAIFQAFFDESGKFKDKHIVSFCGFCSPSAKVLEFEDEWRGLLRHYGLHALSMKRALRRTIRFSENEKAPSVEERNAVLGRFAQCARKYFEMGIAITIDVAAYKKWPAHAKRRVGGSDNPHYMAFICAILGCTHYISGEDRINMICDDDNETAMNCYRIYQRGKTIDLDIKKKLVSITFADDEAFVPLQAADLLASISRLEAGRQFHRDYYEYVPLFHALTSPGAGIRWAVEFYGEDRLNALAKKWK
jgi:Protein of unknown function (DUF3800)